MESAADPLFGGTFAAEVRCRAAGDGGFLERPGRGVKRNGASIDNSNACEAPLTPRLAPSQAAIVKSNWQAQPGLLRFRPATVFQSFVNPVSLPCLGLDGLQSAFPHSPSASWPCSYVSLFPGWGRTMRRAHVCAAVGASAAIAALVSTAPVVVGKSCEPVAPVRKAFPEASSAMPETPSEALPPINVE